MRRPIIAALARRALTDRSPRPRRPTRSRICKDGNVWLTTPDGSRQVQVTTSGIYSYASQADDGTFIALTGERLHKLSRDGKVLADFDTPVSDGPKKGPFENYFMGPYEPEISPDGKLVSYSYAWHHERFDFDCKCVRWGIDSGTAITYPDRQTAVGRVRRPADRLDVRLLDVQRHAPAQLRRARVRRGGGRQPGRRRQGRQGADPLARLDLRHG